MSDSFTKVLVKDSRIANITDSIKYAVVKGAQSINPRNYPTSSPGSTSAQTFVIQTPSESTLISRKVLWNATVTVQVQGTVPAGGYLLNWGVTEALGPFPLASMCSNMQATINNTTISVNMQDVLPSLMRANDNRELSRKNGTTPTAFDTYAYYPDAVQNGVSANNGPFTSYYYVGDNDLIPRGCYPVIISNAWDATNGPQGAPVLYNGTGGPAGRGCYITFTVSEPLLFSPFIFGNPVNDCAMYGICNMTFNFSLSNASRVIRSASWQFGPGKYSLATDTYATGPTAVTVTLSGIQNSKLLIEYLTVHPSDLLSSKNVIPYMNYSRYLTTSLAIQTAANLDNIGNIWPFDRYLGTKVAQVSNTFQLSSIPDSLLISFRVPQAQWSNSMPDFALVISQININFNNQNGILSGALPQDLWRYSVEAGCNQSWLEFQGIAASYNYAISAANAHQLKFIATSGGYLFLEFGRHIQLVDDFLAPGCLGSYSLQITVQVQNQTSADITPELCMITCSSGVLVSDRGVTNSYLGLLSRSDVLNASAMPGYSSKDAERMLGGAWLDKIKSLGKMGFPELEHKVAKLEHRENPYAKKADSVMKTLGAGISGGKHRVERHVM